MVTHTAGPSLGDANYAGKLQRTPNDVNLLGIVGIRRGGFQRLRQGGGVWVGGDTLATEEGSGTGLAPSLKNEFFT